MKQVKDLNSKRLIILKERHKYLDDKVDKINKKNYLSPQEKMDLKVLKVQRLKCKDTIHRLLEEEDV